MNLTRVALALLLLLAAAAAPPSAAGPVALSVRAASADGSYAPVATARIRSDASGRTTAVWPAASPATGIWSATRVPGHGWSAPRQIVPDPLPGDPARPWPLDLIVTPDGAAELLWAVSPGTWPWSSETSVVGVVRRSPHGRWGPATSVPPPPQGFSHVGGAAFASLPGRRTLVAWRIIRPLGQQAPELRMLAAELSADDRWGPVASLSEDGGFPGAPVAVAASREGRSLVAWSAVGAGNSKLVYVAERSADGTFAAPRRLRFPSYDRLWAFLGTDGRTQLVGQGRTMVGASRFGYAESDHAGRWRPPTWSPHPFAGRAHHRWLGHSSVLNARTSAFGGGRVVSAFALQENDYATGTFYGALWSITRDPGKRGSLGPVDLLGATAWPTQVSLGSDAAGRPIATWSASIADQRCHYAVFRASQRPSGSWTRRQLVASGTGPVQADFANCVADTDIRSTDGPAPVLWWTTDRGRRLFVTPTPPTGGAPLPVSASAQPVTWRELRGRGGFDVRCAAPAGAFCTASLLPARSAARPRSNERRALRCLEDRPRARREPGGITVIRFTFRAWCSPSLNPRRLGLRVLVTADQTSRTSGAAWTTLRISR